MNGNSIAIMMSGVKKQYQLGTIGGRTLQEDLQSWWAIKRGREDPNLKIGTDARVNGKYFWALNGIDLTIYRGERIGIIGANGAGKSTLLKLLSRVTAPTAGDIYIWGRVSSLLEVGTGFHRELTGRENIYMNGAILGMNRSEIDERIEDIISFSEVKEFIDTPVKRYSSGMFVRLAFAVAAHLNSEIMIMDEVLAVGDMAFQNKCLDRMQQAADNEGKTILYVSHNMATIRRLCKRCIVLDQGKILFDGNVEDAIAQYMNVGLQDNYVDIDLSKRSFVQNGYNSGLQLKRLILLDKTIPVFDYKEDLRMRIDFGTSIAIKRLVFRITLINDAGVPLGTSVTQEIWVTETGDYSVTICMPVTYIPRGVYYASIEVREMKENNKILVLDRIERGFKFEIAAQFVWNTNMWGYFQLPGSVVEKMYKIKQSYL